MVNQPRIKNKRWKASEERGIITFWRNNETFKFEMNSKKPIYIIDTPPPYVSGRAHLGFAIHYAQIDMIARYKRMQGYNVIFPACVDRNGLPVEVKVEQTLGISMHDMDREEFLQICEKELDKAEENTIQVMKWMGLSCNAFYGSPEIFYKTDSSQYRYITQQTFCKAWYDNLVYEATRPNNWCIDCGTTIADAEIEYQYDQSNLFKIEFNILDSKETIIVATTRPELIPTCELIIFNPSDDRYLHLKGKTALTPLFDKKIPIQSHREAEKDFGTGIMMICAYGDKSDVKILREFNIINPKTMIKPDGTLNEIAEKYQGKTVKEAQEAIILELEEKGFLKSSEPIERQIPTCWRSKTPIEIITMNEYYLKQVNVLPELKNIVDKMKFYPKESKVILENWMQFLTMDWAISRRRYYGTSIPIWYCQKCNFPNVPNDNELLRYYEAWKEKSPISKCQKCGFTLSNARGELRTFDTWFDSSISELAACNFGNIFFKSDKDSFFIDNFPCSIRAQGKEIIRTWLFYTILRSYHLFKEPAFEQIWISGLVLDPYGGKMSKSIGNTVDPLLFLQPTLIPKNTPESIKPDQNSWKKIADREKSPKFQENKNHNFHYGADSVRLTSCLQGSHGSDIKFSLSKLEGHSKFITKLWNIARFISTFPVEIKPIIQPITDNWILSSLDALVTRCVNGYSELDFSIPAENVYNWVWNTFAPHYIELVKSRAYNENENVREERKSAQYTLHKILKTILKLLAPILPFITEYIYQELYQPSRSIHLESFPESENTIGKEDHRTLELINLNSNIWKLKKDQGLSLKDGLKKLYIPNTLGEFISDLKQMHNIDTIIISKPDKNENLAQIGKFRAI